MPALDIFNSDAFSLSSLTTAINEQPAQPGRLGALGLFREEGVTTTSIQIEKSKGALKLVPTSPRGSVAQPVGADKREMRSFIVPHLQEDDSIMADEVQNLRAFGSETDEETLQNYVNQRLGKMRRNLDATLEFHRIGAVKGTILDSDATSVIYNLYTEFGYTQDTVSMVLGTQTTKIRTKVLAAKRKSEDALGNAVASGYRAFCSDSFFDAFVDHDNVLKAYEQFITSFASADPRSAGGFKFADVTWENYRGKVGATSFIADGEAYLVPEGVADLFLTFFAPADYTETVNTLGLPLYAKQELMRFNKGVDVQAQSNPLCMCTRPNAIIKLTAA
jgi:hypothetical protein